MLEAGCEVIVSANGPGPHLHPSPVHTQAHLQPLGGAHPLSHAQALGLSPCRSCDLDVGVGTGLGKGFLRD